MKQILFLILALLVFPTTAFAQSNASSDAIKIMPIIPPQPDTPTNLFGQTHYYTLMFRGNGEAIITFKAILSNTGTTSLKTINLHYPSGLDPKSIAAFQVIQNRQCIRYFPTPLPIDLKTQDKVTLQENDSLYRERCAEYQEPSYEYLSGNIQYQSMQTDVANNTLVLHLPSPIEPNKNGSYFVYFRTKAITGKDPFGAYNYRFETLKTEDKIHSLQVGIATDSDNYIRGAKGDVNYAAADVAMTVPSSAAGIGRAISSPQFDQFYNQIGSGTITKQTSDLAPLETYKVNGLYADSQIKLYGKEIATAVAVILLLVILTVIIVKVTLKKLARQKTDKPEETVVQLKNQNKTFLIAISISFVSMLLVCLYTFGVYAITQILTPNMYYGYSNNSMILALFVFAISSLVYLFFFFGPAVGMGVKKGLGWALVTFSATVVWAILFLLVLFALLLFFSPKGNGYPQPIPLMGGMESRGSAVDAAGSQPAEIQPLQSAPEETTIAQ